jgi:hypothetical protein
MNTIRIRTDPEAPSPCWMFVPIAGGPVSEERVNWGVGFGFQKCTRSPSSLFSARFLLRLVLRLDNLLKNVLRIDVRLQLVDVSFPNVRNA